MALVALNQIAQTMVIVEPGTKVTVRIGSDKYAGQVERLSESEKTLYVTLDHNKEKVLKFREKEPGYWVSSSYSIEFFGEGKTELDPSF